jgi:hypothetical protein
MLNRLNWLGNAVAAGLARSTRDLLNTLAAIAERGARFRSRVGRSRQIGRAVSVVIARVAAGGALRRAVVRIQNCAAFIAWPVHLFSRIDRFAPTRL